MQEDELQKANEQIARLERENEAQAHTIDRQAADIRDRMNAMTTLLGLVSTQVGKPEGEDWKTRCKEYVKLVDPEAPEIIFSWDTGEKNSKSVQASNRAAASNSR